MLKIQPESAIHYYAEILGYRRAQLYRDVVIKGQLVPELSGIPIGSPAPTDVVRRHERVVNLGSS